MSFPKTSLEELELQGAKGNLRRAVSRECNAPELTSETLSEIEQINELIQLVMRACAKGSTVKGRKNPAYDNLLTLIRARDLLAKGKRTPKKSATQILAEAEKLLGANP